MNQDLNKLSGKELEDEKLRQEIIQISKSNKQRRKWFLSPALLIALIPVFTGLITWYLNKDYIKLELDKRALEQEISDLKLDKEDLSLKDRENEISERQNKIQEDSTDLAEKESILEGEQEKFNSLNADLARSKEEYKRKREQLKKRSQEIESKLGLAQHIVDVYEYLDKWRSFEGDMDYIEAGILDRTYDNAKEFIEPILLNLLELCPDRPEGYIESENWIHNCSELKMEVNELLTGWKEKDTYFDAQFNAMVKSKIMGIKISVNNLLDEIHSEQIDQEVLDFEE